MQRFFQHLRLGLFWKQSQRLGPQVVRHLRKNPHGHNTIGTLVVSSVLAFLYFHAQPTTAGTDPVSPDSEELLADVERSFNDSSASPAETTATGNNAESKPADNSLPTLTGRDAILECDRLLGEAQAHLQKVSHYAATFVKQERIGDALTELQVINLRLTHAPMKVFMKWEGGKDAGQRVVYAEGENDGDMLVRKLTGFEARLGVISLNPAGTLAMKHSRYPVSRVGLLSLTKIIREQRAKDLKIESGVSTKMLAKQSIDSREAFCLITEYSKPELAPDPHQEYRKSMIYIDAKTSLPICVRCYGWPEKIAGANPDKLDQTTLLELYAYKNIDFEAQVQHEDFTRAKLQ